MKLPRDVECPYCGADVDQGCHVKGNPYRWQRVSHHARWRAIGIAKPSSEQYLNDFEDCQRRDDLIRKAVFAEWRIHPPRRKEREA